MNTIIRKVSVGESYPDRCLHYQVGTVQKLNRRRYKITEILLNREMLDKGKWAYDIYVKKEPEYSGEPTADVLWKTVIDVPVVVENNIDFD